jgi:hypothetical protein
MFSEVADGGKVVAIEKVEVGVDATIDKLVITLLVGTKMFRLYLLPRAE